MIKNRYFIDHLTRITFIYYFGKIFGLLPIGYYSHPSTKIIVPDMGEFRPSKTGIIFSILRFLMESWTCYIVIKYLLESAMMRTEALCSQGSYCPTFGIMLSHTILALLVVIIVPLRFKSTVNCFNQANYILFNQKLKSNIAVACCAMLTFTISVVIKIVVSKIGFYIKEPELYYPYNIAYLGPIIIINVVSVFCSIGEQAYAEINEELSALCSESASRHRIQRLRHMMDHHWYVTNFVDNVSKCFSIDILLIMVDIYVQLVLFLYVTLWSMFAQRVFLSIWPHIAGLLEMTIITTKLIYLCYRCDRVVSKGNMTIFHLQHLSSVICQDSKAQQMVRMFTLKVNCREVSITACGFFTINLALLVRIMGVVLTYFLVLVQFQVDGETSLGNKTLKTKECPSWPCLKPK